MVGVILGCTVQSPSLAIKKVVFSAVWCTALVNVKEKGGGERGREAEIEEKTPGEGS